MQIGYQDSFSCKRRENPDPLKPPERIHLEKIMEPEIYHGN